MVLWNCKLAWLWHERHALVTSGPSLKSCFRISCWAWLAVIQSFLDFVACLAIIRPGAWSWVVGTAAHKDVLMSRIAISNAISHSATLNLLVFMSPPSSLNRRIFKYKDRLNFKHSNNTAIMTPTQATLSHSGHLNFEMIINDLNTVGYIEKQPGLFRRSK